MKKKLTMWVIGGIITASAMGLGFNTTVGSAAEKEIVKPAMQSMMQGDNKMSPMDPKAMGDMMKNGDMQKNCMEMMKSPEMQSMMKDMMKDMMKTPEMQSMMKEVMEENK